MARSLFSLSMFVGSALAANCWGTQGANPNVGTAQALANSICNGNACAANDAERGDNHFCELSIPVVEGQMVTLQRNDPSGKYGNCMDAYSNILSQCYSGASVNPTDSPNANWSLGDEWYWITFNNSVPSIGQNSYDGDVLVQPNGVPIYGTLEGPTKFCQGLSPGGGESCMDIPAGCRIQVPIDNTIPTLDCSPHPSDA